MVCLVRGGLCAVAYKKTEISLFTFYTYRMFDLDQCLDIACASGIAHFSFAKRQLSIEQLVVIASTLMF